MDLLTNFVLRILPNKHIDHEFGGHFPGLDNPPALLHDLREIADYWV